MTVFRMLVILAMWLVGAGTALGYVATQPVKPEVALGFAIMAWASALSAHVRFDEKKP